MDFSESAKMEYHFRNFLIELLRAISVNNSSAKDGAINHHLQEFMISALKHEEFPPSRDVYRILRQTLKDLKEVPLEGLSFELREADAISSAGKVLAERLSGDFTQASRARDTFRVRVNDCIDARDRLRDEIA